MFVNCRGTISRIKTDLDGQEGRRPIVLIKMAGLRFDPLMETG